MSTAVAPAPGSTTAPAEVARARIAVLVATFQVDVVVPTKFTIETFIDDLIAVLAEAVTDADAEVDFAPPRGQWSLARPGEAPIPRWRSLADHDVVDGSVLMLSVVESAEVFTPVVEDITDALALINDREFAEFDTDTATLAGLMTLCAGSVAVSAMLAWSWTTTGAVLWCALPALLLGAGCWAAGLVSRRRDATPEVCLGLVLAALPLLFSGGAMVVPHQYGEPGPFAMPNVATGAVVAAVAAAAMMRLTTVGIATLLAVTVLGTVVAVAAVVATYAHVSPHQVAGAAALAGLVLLTGAPRLAVVAARIRPPDLPDPGTEVATATLADIFDTASGRAEEPGQGVGEELGRPVEFGIEARARLAVTGLRGLIAAASLLFAAGSVIAVVTSPGGIREIALGVAVAGILALRARWYPDRVQAITLIASAVATVVGIGVVLTLSYTSVAVRLLPAVAVAVVVSAGCVAALRLPGRRLSPVTRRIIDLCEYALILAVPVLACWIMGIYTAMRAL